MPHHADGAPPYTLLALISVQPEGTTTQVVPSEVTIPEMTTDLYFVQKMMVAPGQGRKYPPPEQLLQLSKCSRSTLCLLSSNRVIIIDKTKQLLYARHCTKRLVCTIQIYSPKYLNSWLLLLLPLYP